LQQALVKQAEATIQGAEADLTRYHLEAVRQQTLLAEGGGLAGTRQLTEQAIDNEKKAEATLALNWAQLDQQRQQLNVLDSQEKQAHATLDAQQAARKLAEINLGYTRITAPVDGMVGQRQVQAGQYVNVGTQVISVVPLPNVWVIANYKETQMTRVRIGQPAQVTVDAFPGLVLHGHVDSWSPASGAQFSLLPPDNATGNFTKVVQRIPVKIVVDPDPAVDELLRPGMSVIATIDTSSTPPGLGAGAK
jgi:membrane fusion protein, multidrug efflux system